MNSMVYQIAGYGLVAIAGGIDGYVSKGSVASILAGGVLGGALCASAWALNNDREWGWWGSVLVTLVLVLKFVPDFRESGAIYPAGVMAALGLWVLGVLIVDTIREEPH